MGLADGDDEVIVLQGAADEGAPNVAGGAEDLEASVWLLRVLILMSLRSGSFFADI